MTPKRIVEGDLADREIDGQMAEDLPITVIERQTSWKIIDFEEMWRYRGSLYFLTWRDIKVRYKQTVLGAAWAVLQPFAYMMVFSLFLGRVADLSSGNLPYPLFVYAGLVPWMFFSASILQGANSVVASQNLVTKVYFPRLFIPVGAVGAVLVDFVIAFSMLPLLTVYFVVFHDFTITLGWNIVLLPIITLGLLFTALGVGIFLAALTVAFRDVRHIVPFLVQLWMIATPSVYMYVGTVRKNPFWAENPRLALVLPLNPVFGFIENFRLVIFGLDLNLYSLFISSMVGVVLMTAGCFYFRRVERSFADII